MSKRLRNKHGKQGRSLHNTQWCKEHGRQLAKKMRAEQQDAITDLLEKPDPTQGFF